MGRKQPLHISFLSHSPQMAPAQGSPSIAVTALCHPAHPNLQPLSVPLRTCTFSYHPPLLFTGPVLTPFILILLQNSLPSSLSGTCSWERLPCTQLPPKIGCTVFSCQLGAVRCFPASIHSHGLIPSCTHPLMQQGMGPWGNTGLWASPMGSPIRCCPARYTHGGSPPYKQRSGGPEGRIWGAAPSKGEPRVGM